MRIDLTCPVELWHCKMPTADNPVFSMQVYNLSDLEVNSIQVCVLCYDQEGEQYARHVERLQGLEIPARHAYELNLALEEAVEAQDLDVIIEKAWFVDGTVWRRGNTAPAEYKPSPSLKGPQLRVMQELAGPDAVCYPSDQGSVWVCVCGRANAARDEECRRCRRDKHELFTKLNEAAIEKIIFTRQNALEEQQRRQREEARRAAQAKEAAESRRRKIRKIVITSAVSLLLLCGIAYGVYFHGIPYYRYYQANRALEGNQYDAAKEQFLALGDYRDSADMARECDYRAALSALNGCTYTSLRAAWNGFDQLEDYKDSESRAQEARYIYAEKLLAANNWEEAIALYEQVPSYSDARMKRNQAAYDWAADLMAKGEFAQAQEKFLSLGDYQNAASQAQECQYLLALNSLQTDPAAAIELFRALDDYRDSPVRLQSAYYAAGSQYYDEQDYDTAAEYFLAAGDYSDAFRRATQCLYTPAVNAMNSGDYARAAEMFEKIVGYQDAKERLARCYYQIGLALMKEGAYDGAISNFALAADDLPEAEEARKECVYLTAMGLLDNGLTQDAITLLATISTYKDAGKQMNQLLYAQAGDSIESKDYPAAIETLEQLGQYADSEAELKAARLAYAKTLIDGNQYETAIEVLSPLDGFPDAEEYMNRARYLLALDLKSQNKLDEALPILEALGNYADARSQYEDCVYQTASALAEKGELADASALFGTIAGYQDATDKMQSYAYQAAADAAEQGDLAGAAALYAKAGTYQNAEKLAQSTADQYYATAYEKAKAAMGKKDYLTAVETLAEIKMEFVPEKYADMPGLYKEACYQYAEALYSAKKPFEALKYYRLITDYKDVSSKKLNRSVYRIMSNWESASKNMRMSFLEDGTCVIDGKASYYIVGVNGAYALSVGDSPDNLTYTYNILSLNDKELNIRNVKTKTVYKMNKVD